MSNDFETVRESIGQEREPVQEAYYALDRIEAELERLREESKDARNEAERLNKDYVRLKMRHLDVEARLHRIEEAARKVKATHIVGTGGKSFGEAMNTDPDEDGVGTPRFVHDTTTCPACALRAALKEEA